MIPNACVIELPEGPAVAMPVNRGPATLVDPDVAEILAGHCLCAHRGGYVTTYHQGRSVFVHRLVCPPPAGLEVDHINADKRDNRRVNLRAVTRSVNVMARRCCRAKAGYRGVYLNHGRCTIRVTWQHRVHSAPSYASALVAALARDDLARQVTGLEEGLNFPHSIGRRELRGFLEALGPRLFGVVFVRRTDGAARRMVCRTGVAPDRTGPGLAFDPADYNLYSVFDVRRRQYRFLPLENVLCLTCNRKRYRVTA